MSVAITKSSITSTILSKPAIIVGSYSESNFKFTLDQLSSIDAHKVGMNFQNTGNATLDSCQFLLTKTGSPTGNIVAKLYAITGTYGVDSVPTGSALASSNNIDATTLHSTTGDNILSDRTWVTFSFSGLNRYALQAGVNYVIAVEYSGGGVGNYVEVSGGDSNLPTGNPVQDYGSGWGTYTGDAYNFYVYSIGSGVTSTVINKSSVTPSSLTKPASLIDSYSVSNFGFSLTTLGSLSFSDLKAGMNFTNASQVVLDSCIFYLSKTGSPTGTMTANLYAISGTFGSTSIPTGSALATSDSVNISTITKSSANGDFITDYQAITFSFSGANRYLMPAGHYVIDIEYSGGDATNFLFLAGGGGSLPTGNPVDFNYPSGPWTTYTGDAYVFYVYGVGPGTASTAVSKSTITSSKLTKS